MNPHPANQYNLVVIGAGTAGLVTAAGAAGLGAKVALIERSRMGGDCLNVGCVPSKGMIASAWLAHSAREAPRFGVLVGDVEVDFAAVMKRVYGVRAAIAPHDSAKRFTELGVDVFFGEASFVSPDAVEVDGATLRFARAAIATGARPAVPPIAGLAQAGYQTNETLFELDTLPARFTVIGGGAIGCEMAQAFARLGSKVTLIDAAGRLLSQDDPDAAEVVAASLARDGIDLILGAAVDRVDGDKTVHVAGRRIESDRILVATGRLANIEELALPNAGVEATKRGVAVDDRLRTTNNRVYAAGDVASRFHFTHAADAMARIVVRNALFWGRAKASALVIPWATYTDPELAHVGLTPQLAHERGVAIDTFEVRMADIDRSRIAGESEGFLRVHVVRGTDKIVGATMVSLYAGELISHVATSMHAGVGLSSIAASVFPYPTRAEAFKRAADAWSKTRLTPRVARFVAWLLRRRRA